MERHIDNCFDNELLSISGLTWLPWIGKDFKNNKKRLLIVGESHYSLAENDKEYQRRFQEATNNKYFTRKCIYESPICENWRNNTFENIHRVLLRSNNLDKGLFWEQVVFYNFIPRLMDYRIRERPTPVDFYSSWKIFIEIINILKPTDCIFIGVSASNSFNQAMQELRLKHEPVKWLESIGRAYARTSSVAVHDNTIKLSFIQHASQMFSWNKWNQFLERENKETLTFLKTKVFKKGIPAEEITDAGEDANSAVNIPMYLAHKPIIACDYSVYTNADDDAKYLSIGHGQYDFNSASVKIFRHTGEKWSRQSEELPINRVGDLALLLLSAMKKVYNPNSDTTILNEEVLKEEELDFLRDEFESNKERLKGSFLEIKRLLNEFDIEKI